MKKNFNNATEALNFSAKVRKFLYKHNESVFVYSTFSFLGSFATLFFVGGFCDRFSVAACIWLVVSLTLICKALGDAEEKRWEKR